MAVFRTAEILAVGSELLTPFRADTNSLTLTSRLNDLGITVTGKSIAGDDAGRIAALMTDALGRVDLVMTTGGLGPTEDDVTREAVARALGLALSEDSEVVKAIEARFARRGIPMPATNRRQALVPDGAVVLANAGGTAPGLWIDVGDKAIVLLPGPPRELRAMLDGDLGARLSARSGGQRLARRVIRTTGRSESGVDEVAAPIYLPWQTTASLPIQTTILAGNGQIDLHLSTTGTDLQAIDRRLDAAARDLTDALGDIVISADGRPLEVVVGDALRTRGNWIAVAESCTGGSILTRLTDVAGSSAYVRGGVVAYDNAVKVDELGVPQALLDAHGAVSEPVAIAMADGVRARLRAEVGVAVTGIAGPSGGTPAKPVGTVVIALSVAGGTSSARTFTFLGDRATVRALSTTAALDMVRRALV